MPIPPRTPAESFAALLAWLGRAVAARSGGERLSLSLIALIIGRIRDINQRVARLAARIRDGRYTRRIVAAPRRGVTKPRRPNPLPQTFGWLLQLVPEAVGSRSQLENLFRDADMAALMAAAPASIGRPLRSLCHMLGLRPPPILASPARRATPPAAPQASQASPPLPRRTPEAASAVVPAHACGPPHPA